MGNASLLHIALDLTSFLKADDKELSQKANTPEIPFSSMLSDLFGDKPLEKAEQNEQNLKTKSIDKIKKEIKTKEPEKFLEGFDTQKRVYHEISIEELLKFSKFLSKNENLTQKFPSVSNKLQKIISNKKTIKEFKNAKTIKELIGVAKKHNIKISSLEIGQIKKEALDKNIRSFDPKRDMVKTESKGKSKRFFHPTSREILSVVDEHKPKNIQKAEEKKPKAEKTNLLKEILKKPVKEIHQKRELQTQTEVLTKPLQRETKKPLQRVLDKKGLSNVLHEQKEIQKSFFIKKKDVKISDKKELKREFFSDGKVEKDRYVHKGEAEGKIRLKETFVSLKEPEEKNFKSADLKEKKVPIQIEDSKTPLKPVFKEGKEIKESPKREYHRKDQSEFFAFDVEAFQDSKNKVIKTAVLQSPQNISLKQNEAVLEASSELLGEKTKKRDIKESVKEQKRDFFPKSVENIKTDSSVFSLALSFTEKTEDEEFEKESKEFEIKDEIKPQNSQVFQKTEIDYKKREFLPQKTFSSFANDFKEAVQNYKPPVTKISMTLNPENLGEVKVTLIHRGENLHVSINSNPNTIAIFTQNHTEFKNALSNIGFSNLQMSFSQNNQQERQNQNPYKTIYKYDKENEEEQQQNSINFIVPRYI